MRIGNIRHPPKNIAGLIQVRVDRTSVLGNPYHIGMDGTRLAVIVKYGTWLCEILRGNNSVTEAIAHLVNLELNNKEVILMCWCFPQSCHAEIIRQVVLNIVVGTREQKREHQAIMMVATNIWSLS